MILQGSYFVLPAASQKLRNIFQGVCRLLPFFVEGNERLRDCVCDTSTLEVSPKFRPLEVRVGHGLFWRIAQNSRIQIKTMAGKIVSEELTAYLAQHQVYTKLQQAMEAVALHKPSSPAGFLRDFFNPDSNTGVKPTSHVVFVGPPCSGKTTQAHMLAEALGYECICTQSLAGDSAKRNAGSLCENDDIIGAVKVELLAKKSLSWVLDGFARTEIEAFSMKASAAYQPTHVIELRLPLDAILTRARAKEDPEAVRAEERVYAANRRGIRAVFEASFRTVDCTGLSEDAIHERVMAILSAPPVLKTADNEVLPRGPAIIDAQTEVGDFTLSRVPNTIPTIEEVTPDGGK